MNGMHNTNNTSNYWYINVIMTLPRYFRIMLFPPDDPYEQKSLSVTDWFPLSSRKPTGYSLNVLPKLMYWQNAWIDAAAPTNAGMQVTLNVACTHSQQNTKVSGVLWP